MTLKLSSVGLVHGIPHGNWNTAVWPTIDLGFDFVIEICTFLSIVA